MSELGRKVVNIMTREMGQLGGFIVSKQCKDLGLDQDNLKISDLGKLSEALSAVMITFGGPDKARAIRQEIRDLDREE